MDVPVNFVEQILPFALIFVGMLVFFIIIMILSFPIKKLAGLRKQFFFNAIVRFFLIFYLPLEVICVATFYQADFSGTSGILGAIFGIILQLVLLIFLALPFL